MKITKPSKYQEALINKLLSINYEGAEDLRKQLASYQVEVYDDADGCGSFAIYPDKSGPVANTDSTIPVEGLARNKDDTPIEYLLHVNDGYVHELEVVVYSGKLDEPIPVDAIEVMTHDERIKRENERI